MRTVVALLGRGDTPADGVADYCQNLASALNRHGCAAEVRRVPWFERGWFRALTDLRLGKSAAPGDWAMLQYTALAWSRRGFPLGAVAAVFVLRLRGVQCGVVFHEPCRQGLAHERMIDRARASCQDWVVRLLHRFTSLSVFTIPLSSVRWLPASDLKTAFIPLGPNVPENLSGARPTRSPADPHRTVCVFCLSGAPALAEELDDISAACHHAAATGNLKLKIAFIGRGTESAPTAIDAAFANSGIEVINYGLQDPPEISRVLSDSDVLLCVRGTLTLRRGSALAGIACGVPMVGYAGAADGTPLTEAGVILVPLRDQQALGDALSRVLLDKPLSDDLRRKNIATQKKYFSWDTIAESYRQAFARAESTQAGRQ